MKFKMSQSYCCLSVLLSPLNDKCPICCEPDSQSKAVCLSVGAPLPSEMIL